MRYVNGAMDPDSASSDVLRKLNHLLETHWDPTTRDLLIKVINAGWPITDEQKLKMIDFLVDEDFANEHFAMVWYTKLVLELGNSVNAYAGD